MPFKVAGGLALMGVVSGAVLGFTRGLQHTPTLVFAGIEGAVLIGVPAGLLGLLIVACWQLCISGRSRRWALAMLVWIVGYVSLLRSVDDAHGALRLIVPLIVATAVTTIVATLAPDGWSSLTGVFRRAA